MSDYTTLILALTGLAAERDNGSGPPRRLRGYEEDLLAGLARDPRPPATPRASRLGGLRRRAARLVAGTA